MNLFEDFEKSLTFQDCSCHSCINRRGDMIGGLPRQMCEMILCPSCGNKRCPRANFHENVCTNSNTLGQVGSAY